MTKKFLGDLAEDYVRHYLERHGLIWECSQYRCSQGEIDLIMHDQNALVFIEVRYRQKTKFGDSVETVSRIKQGRLIKAAWHFLMERRWVDKVNCRFDVIGLSAIPVSLSLDEGEINWIQNAFEVKY